MNIRKLFRRYLTEAKHISHKNEYGCVFFTLDIDKESWSSLLDQIDDQDLYNPPNDKTYGKEKKPHVTVLFGLHGNIDDKEVEEIITGFKKPKVKLDSITAFKGKKFDVLKFDVISDDLVEQNKKLKELPFTNDYPNYHPHVTIAYLKPNLSDKYIDKMKKTKLDVSVGDIIYSKVDGSEKKYQI